MSCDIIVPIYNSLSAVKACLNAVYNCTQSSDYHLYLIDDASEITTHHYLQNQLVKHKNITLHTHNENLGFVKACNTGFSLGTAPYVLLLNSDVIVTPNWLPRLLACIQADKRIAAVNPLTNHAPQIDLPMLPGCNFYDMDQAISQNVHCLDVVTNVGFCLLLRRSTLMQVGVFDEIYGRGYCEESDLCMRLTTHGFRTVVASNVYVYHQGGATFEDGLSRYLHNRHIFDQRWKQEYWRQFRAFQRNNPLKSIRSQFTAPQRWCPTPAIWATYRILLKCWQNHQWISLSFNALRGIKHLIQSTCAEPDLEKIAKVTRPNRLKVTYLLNKLVVAGGVLIVTQLVNELILLGIEARIATLFVDPEIHHWRLLTEPLVFKNEQALIQHFPPTDIVIATHWQTAAWAAEIIRQNKATTSVYYLQDYEAWFTPHSAQQVIQTYQWISNKIVTSTWLQNLLQQAGYTSKKIVIGTDIDTFYPRQIAKKSHLTLLTMARPGTPWRGFTTVIQALEKVKTRFPHLEIVFFGDNQLVKQKISFNYKNEGIVFQQNKLAHLYSTADIFLEGSDYQGFGLSALEAMACGTACVLTHVGGVNEYSRHSENCWLVPPRNPQAMAEAISQLLTQTELRQKLAAAGLMTVKNYSIQQVAQQTLDYFTTLIHDQQA